MSSNSKKFAAGLVTVFVLSATGLATPVLAAEITETFATNDTLTAAKMNAIKDAANNTNTRLGTAEGTVTTLGTRVTALETGAPPCPTNMTRVGAACIDQAQVANSVTWAGAIAACATAGKRLLTPSEFYRAHAATVISLADGNSEWVDSVVPFSPTGNNTGADGSGLFGVVRMGPDIGSPAGSGTGVLGLVATDGATDAVGASVGFRCAR